MSDAERYLLEVKGYTFECFYQQGTYVDALWKQSSDGDLHVFVCKCGRGVCANSIDDAFEKLKASYSMLRPDAHWHWEDSLRFNIILATDGKWIMGTIKSPELLDELTPPSSE